MEAQYNKQKLLSKARHRRVDAPTLLILLLLILMQCLLVVKIASVESWPLAEWLWRVPVAGVSVGLMFATWYLLVAHWQSRARVVFTYLLLGLYFFLWLYHWVRLEPLSFLLLVKNGGNLISAEALGFVITSVTPLDWVIWLGLAALLVFLQHRANVGNSPRFRRASRRWLWLLLSLNLLAAVAFSSGRNEYVEFAASVYRYYQPQEVGGTANLYPYLRRHQADKSLDNPPHVFIVMLESFSAGYIDRRENGKEITPFFNQLKHQGLYVPHFFSASVETSKGQFATLCSVMPGYKSNVFTSYADHNYHCLPEILQAAGYTNVFMKAYHTLAFENTGEFVRRQGFSEHAHAMDDRFVSDQERRRHTIGWGIRDDLFYQKLFDYLDGLHRQDSEARFFVTTMSVTNHMMFDDIPPGQRYIHPDPESHEDNYANSMHLTDQYLKRFFTELKSRVYLDNSLVVVLGDNGFPMGQHNNYHNTKTVYNELFKTPLLVWWPGQVQPATLATARSQLDVAPTVLDLLEISTEHHFLGESVLRDTGKDYFVPLIQPFDGGWLASIRYPFKYTRHLKTGREAVYQLRDDPGESNNLLERENRVTPGMLARFAEDINRIQLNEILLKENRIFPASQRDTLRVRLPANPLARGEDLPLEILGHRASGHQVRLSLHSYGEHNSRAGEYRLDEDLPGARIPADYLQPGLNRVTVESYFAGEQQSVLHRDIYVQGEQVALLSDLNIEGRQGWGRLHINRSVRGNPLSIGGQTYDYGLGTHAASRHQIALGGRYRRFYTGFGLDDESTCGDGAIFRIEVDGKTVFTSERLRNGHYGEITLDITGAEQLTLITDTAGGRACDHTNWVAGVLHGENKNLEQAAPVP